jgi:hypothetical protein
MAVSKRSTTINGKLYELNTLPASRGLPILTWLAGTIGEGTLRSISTQSGDDSVLSLAGAVASRLDSPRTAEMVSALLDGLYCNSSPVQFDNHFAANYGELASVVGWAMKENFGSFFDGNALLSKFRPMIQIQTPSPGA